MYKAQCDWFNLCIKMLSARHTFRIQCATAYTIFPRLIAAKELGELEPPR